MANRSTSADNTTDNLLFVEMDMQNKLQYALGDLYYLLYRGYPLKASLELAGNRYQLVKRQMQALQGMACSPIELNIRKYKEQPPAAVKDQTILLDGFNILILLETVLSGGLAFEGLDGCYRDISSVHGSYRTIENTEQALVLIGKTLQQLELQKVIWVFDAPVSNSGKLKNICYDLAAKHHFPWEIILENAPDKYLIENSGLICSSDSWVLNECKTWFNLGAYILNEMPEAELISYTSFYKEEKFNKSPRIVETVVYLQNKLGAANVVINKNWEGSVDDIALTDKTGKKEAYISLSFEDENNFQLTLDNLLDKDDLPNRGDVDFNNMTLDELENLVARHFIR